LGAPNAPRNGRMQPGAPNRPRRYVKAPAAHIGTACRGVAYRPWYPPGRGGCDV